MNGQPILPGEGEREVRDANPETSGRFDERRSWLERARDEVTAWLGDRDALRRRQWDEAVGDHSGQGPAPVLDGDARILDDVSRHLTGDRVLDASRIEVEVLAGRVTLTGYVLTLADKHRAEDLADGVTGVSGVINRLGVG